MDFKENEMQNGLKLVAYRVVDSNGKWKYSNTTKAARIGEPVYVRCKGEEDEITILHQLLSTANRTINELKIQLAKLNKIE